MSKPEKHYSSEEYARSLTKIRKWVLKKEYSCDHPPLLDVSLENVVLDELHLMLRVTGNEWYRQCDTLNAFPFSD